MSGALSIGSPVWRNLLWWRSFTEWVLVTIWHSRLFARLAAVGMLAFALGLSGCGRKGGLDPPPSAAIEPPPPTAQSGAGPEQTPPSAQPGFTPDGRAIPAPGAKKRLPIDILVD
jgi:predicted small lipoprotein YifL